MDRDEYEEWLRALEDATADEARIQRELSELNARLKRLKAKREELKEDLRDAVRAKKAAAYAVKARKRPR